MQWQQIHSYIQCFRSAIHPATSTALKSNPIQSLNNNISTETHHQQAPSKQKEEKLVSSSLSVLGDVF